MMTYSHQSSEATLDSKYNASSSIPKAISYARVTSTLTQHKSSGGLVGAERISILRDKSIQPILDGTTCKANRPSKRGVDADSYSEKIKHDIHEPSIDLKHTNEIEVSTPAQLETAVVTIQAIFRGQKQREQLLAILRKECIDLRKRCREKDIQLAANARDLEYKAIVIEQLQKQSARLMGSDSYAMTASALETPSAISKKSSECYLHSGALETDTTCTPSDAKNPIDNMLTDIQNLSIEFSATESLKDDLSPTPLSASGASLAFSKSTPISIWTPPVNDNVAARSYGSSIEANMDAVRYIWTPQQTSGFKVNKYNEYYGQSEQPVDIGAVDSLLMYDYSLDLSSDDIVNADLTFKILVEKIIKTNDQPSSIYLQQRLKTDTMENKALIFDAVLEYVIPLVKNRFGNFLVQCCLDYCTCQQIWALANCMHGQVITLSCDRFGCHVMQKVIDKVDKDIKILLISELYQSIVETFTHRFACHVWQRVFETSWTGKPPNIMESVQSVLSGYWNSIANDENGSLVVQCIFDNCTEEETGPIISEIFKNTAELAKGQWGNWVIQHIVAHGSTLQRSHILEVVSQNIYQLSTDQFASKVVEKCIKLASKREAQALIDKILAPQPTEQGRPFLLGMMNNQYANYVVQNVLSVVDSVQREACIRLLTPHLTLLKGSKYGQRVASMCEKSMRTSHHKFGTSSLNTINGFY
ncbi:meiotic PUF protein 1 [Batrachochytrium dendrobatidis]